LGTICARLFEHRNVIAKQPVSGDEVRINRADGSEAKFLVGLIAAANKVFKIH
jgi:hypothetical protein